jgi:hypothetical protein
VESDDAGGAVDVGQGDAPFRAEDRTMMVPRSPYRVITMFLMTGLEMAKDWVFVCGLSSEVIFLACTGVSGVYPVSTTITFPWR